jgi:hypothetical protein
VKTVSGRGVLRSDGESYSTAREVVDSVLAVIDTLYTHESTGMAIRDGNDYLTENNCSLDGAIQMWTVSVGE